MLHSFVVLMHVVAATRYRQVGLCVDVVLACVLGRACIAVVELWRVQRHELWHDRAVLAISTAALAGVLGYC